MSGDDRIDVLDRGNNVRERLRVRGDAAAIAGVDVGKRFPREHVAGMHRPDCWKDDEHVSVELVLGHLVTNAGNAKKIIAHLLPRLKYLPNDAATALRSAIFTQPQFIKPAIKKKLAPLIGKYVN